MFSYNIEEIQGIYAVIFNSRREKENKIERIFHLYKNHLHILYVIIYFTAYRCCMLWSIPTLFVSNFSFQ